MSGFRWDFDEETSTFHVRTEEIFLDMYRKMIDIENSIEDEAVAQYLRDKGWTVTK